MREREGVVFAFISLTNGLQEKLNPNSLYMIAYQQRVSQAFRIQLLVFSHLGVRVVAEVTRLWSSRGRGDEFHERDEKRMPLHETLSMVVRPREQEFSRQDRY